MPFSHHSHSGQFCPGHAKNSLEEIIQKAIEQKMQLFCLTEHMPRAEEDFYPEEKTELGTTEKGLVENEAAYWHEALELRTKYTGRIKIMIGFEIDWIRPESLTLINESLKRFPFEFLVGSLHHVHTIPIDYDAATYQQARDVAGGTDERLFEDYFDAQFDMLQKVKPPVIGHFDLIRLKSDDPNATFTRYPQVWEKIKRNLEFAASYGGLVELNSAALRKGMSEPYPKAEICKEYLSLGGHFCMSDDSHGVDQIAFGYGEMLEFMERTGITTLHQLYLSLDGEAPDWRFPVTRVRGVPLQEVKKAPFWS